MIVGLRCAVCETTVDIATPFAWACPRATAHDPHHVLHFLHAGPEPELLARDNPFVRFGPRLAWWQFARANGMTESACEALTWEVAGDFSITPLVESPSLADAARRPVWAKDETGNVGGSHKARHLASILLHLRAAELLGLSDAQHGQVRPSLAIASCGNAAIAAATLAQRAGWPLDVFVPTWMDDAVGDTLDALGARITRCERRDDDLPGDPALHRFRDAVRGGAIPFSVQGPENAYCLDGGRTIGWELAEQIDEVGLAPGAVYAQVGGGAFAACLSQGLGHRVPLVAVQAEGAAPLSAALARAAGMLRPEQHWAEVMQPWAHPQSLADGILDDETYDWIAVSEAIEASGGRSNVVPELAIERAHAAAVSAGFTVSPTGAAGLAGVLTEAAAPGPAVVVMSGVAR